MSDNLFTSYNPEVLAIPAAHFGVSVDNYLSSVPVIGIEGIEIAHSGLIVVGPKAGHTARQELRPAEWFRGVYNISSNADDYKSTESTSEPVDALIPEVVDDFCKERNIHPIVAAKVGARLLRFASITGAGIGVDLEVFAQRTLHNKGLLDSTLSFSISSINTIIMQRNKSSGLEKLKARFAHR